MIVSLGEFGIILSLPLWLQNVLGYDALQTGFVLLALAVGSFVASRVRRRVRRPGRARRRSCASASSPRSSGS